MWYNMSRYAFGSSPMKKFEEHLLKCTGYTVIILLLFYLFAATGDFTHAAITFPTFVTIFAFGAVISVAEIILKLESLKKWLRVLIHYAALLLAFIVVFVITGNLRDGGTGLIFSALIIFTFFYALIFAIVYFVRKAIGKAESKRRANKPVSKKTQKKPAPAPYRSRFGGND